MMNEPKVSYAQNYEDIILAGFFEGVKEGFYVDVGAFDPIEDSVTKYFYDRGWRGISIEPNKKYFKKLVRDRPDDLNLNVGVSDKPGESNFREYIEGEGLSTFSPEMIRQYENARGNPTKKYQDYKVKTDTLKNIFHSAKVDKINFLKIDVEGHEYEVIKGNDWDLYRPEVLCIESNHIVKDWRPLLADTGYTLAFNDGLNDYYVANEASKRAKKFSYVEAMLGQPVISYKWQKELKKLKASTHRSQLIAKTLSSNNRKLSEEIIVLENHIAAMHRTRKLAKELLKAIDKTVLFQLDKLTSSRGVYPKTNFAGKDDISSLLSVIQNADRQALFARPGFVASTRLAAGKLVLGCYLAARKIAAFFARLALRLIRAVLYGDRRSGNE